MHAPVQDKVAAYVYTVKERALLNLDLYKVNTTGNSLKVNLIDYINTQIKSRTELFQLQMHKS